MASPRCLTLLPRTHECVALHGKRNLQVYLSWRCGDGETILGGPNVITRVLLRENQDIREEKRCYAAGFEGGERGHNSKNGGGL